MNRLLDRMAPECPLSILCGLGAKSLLSCRPTGPRPWTQSGASGALDSTVCAGLALRPLCATGPLPGAAPTLFAPRKQPSAASAPGRLRTGGQAGLEDVDRSICPDNPVSFLPVVIWVFSPFIFARLAGFIHRIDFLFHRIRFLFH